MIPVVGPEAERALDWLGVARAIEAGHRLPRARVADVTLRQGPDTLLNRSAWIEGLGLLVKACTIVPGQAARGLPTIAGAVNLFAGDGRLEAVLDFGLVTRWKTAGDSLLGARRLARPDSREVLILGAGTVAASLVDAYRAGFPEARVRLWNRSRQRAEALAAEKGAEVADDLAAAVARADIVSAATMASEPILRGAWLRPGQHLDLIGSYRPDMREADEAAVAGGRLFCDSRETTVGHVGEVPESLRDRVVADHYEPDLMRREGDEVTIFKNGGGGHLDLMVARHVLDSWRPQADPVQAGPI